MLKIRLARIGKKKRPMYRIVVSDSAKDLFGTQVEIIGNYNPFSKVCDVDKDRVKYWMEHGAQPSPSAHNLLVSQNVIEGKKVKAFTVVKTKVEPAPAAPAAAPVAPVAETPVAEAPAAPEAAPAEAAPETPVAETPAA